MTSSATSQILGQRDTRRAVRRRVLLSGKIAYGDGVYSFNCTIRDISSAGARVAIPKTQSIPGSLFLIDIKNHIAYAACVVWHRPPLVGLAFTATYPLSQPLEPQLEFVKRLWFDCAARR